MGETLRADREQTGAADPRYAGLTSRVVAVLLGISLVVLLGLHRVFGDRYYWYVAAFASIVIALIYPIVAEASHRDVRFELSVAIPLIALSIIGALFAPVLIVGAVAGHGIWDMLKHRDHLGIPFFGWYPPACAAIDVGYALLLALFAPTWSA